MSLQGMSDLSEVSLVIFQLDVRWLCSQYVHPICYIELVSDMFHFQICGVFQVVLSSFILFGDIFEH